MRHLVDRVDHGPQVGDGVLDLAPVVEPGAADHLVGDVGPHELLFQHPALGVGAVEDGDVAPLQPSSGRAGADDGLGRAVQAGDLAGDPLGLVDLVVGVVADDRVARALVGPQLLGLAGDVVGDDGVGGVEDGLRRPVVLLEQHHRRVGEGVLELDDVAHVGAAEGVDRLVLVADDADVAVVGGEQQHQVVLHPVRVLVLVDEDVLEPAAGSARSTSGCSRSRRSAWPSRSSKSIEPARASRVWYSVKTSAILRSKRLPARAA